MTFRDTPMPDCPCLNCGKVLDMAASPEDHKPYPGGITICIACGHIMAFDSNLALRPLTDQEMHLIAGDRKLIALMKARSRLKGATK